jgi:23S rRNA pseudouridine2605 synthase
VWLADPKTGGFRTQKSYIKLVKRSGKQSVLQITIKEGRNRQVRRTLAKLGHKVRELTRIKIGPLEIGKLKPGEFRILHKREVDALRKRIEEGQERTVARKAAQRKPAIAVEASRKPGSRSHSAGSVR